MSFCTECGKPLPDKAVFCPNCGHLRCERPTPETENDAPGTAETAGETTGSYSQPQYASPYGLGDDIYRSGGKSGGSGKAAAIIVCTVLVLLIIAAAIIISNIGKGSPCIGYWVSEGLSYGGGMSSDTMYGQPVDGMFRVEISDDGSVSFSSAFTEGTSTGSWETVKNGIEADFSGERLSFSYDKSGDTLSLSYLNGISIIFHRSTGGIGKSSETAPPAKKANTIAGSGTLGDYYVSVIGAEEFTDVDSRQAIRIYYEFTNNSENDTDADKAITLSATQDGQRLKQTYSWEDVAVSGNNVLFIRPGVTIQCCCEYKYSPTGSAVDFTATDSDSGASVTASYLPGELPGAPLPFEAEAVTSPQWTLALPAERSIDSYHISVKDAQLTTDYYDAPAIRIFYEFTNNSDTELSLEDALYTCAYQDGIELSYTSELVGLTSDENYFATVAPGQSLSVSCVFLLRNETSPVEAEVESYTSFDAAGQTYNIK